MTSLSRKFVLMVVLLQLCLSVREVNAGGKPSKTAGTSVDLQGLQFGDILEFPMENKDKANKANNENEKPDFKHYAVYVGGEKVNGKRDDQNIFEMTNDPAGCQFDVLEGPVTKNNYFDGVQGMVPQSKADMIKTIEDLMNKQVCKEYSVFTGNCEHIATTVRYGRARCVQPGTKVGQHLARLLPNPNLKQREASAAA